jgi:exonuclease SbcC
MLTKVEIENFQSHKSTILEFIPGTNVIIGESDAGKSAIFRAINWVISNRPLGDAFRSEWGGETRVILHTSDKHKIERIRSATRNEYILDGKVFKAFGTEPPEEVLNILQLDSFNIQAQMDPPFLLAHSPGEAARILNKAASIDDIDKAISGIKTVLTKFNIHNKHREEQLKKAEQEIQKYENLPEIEKKVRLIEQWGKKKEGLSKGETSLRRVQKEVARIHSELDEMDNLPELLEMLSQAEKTYLFYQTKASLYNNIKRSLARIKELQARLKQMEEGRCALEQITAITEDYSRLKEAKKKAISLNKLLVDMGKTKTAGMWAKQDLEKTEEEYHRIAPETCPLCGGELSKLGGIGC